MEEKEIQRIKLDPALMDRVRDGDKTMTIRLGRKDYKLGPALLVNAVDEADTIEIYIDLLTLELVRGLDGFHAQECGYFFRWSLIKGLKQHYPMLHPYDLVTVVGFHTDEVIL